MMLASLTHSRVDGIEFARRNGNFTLSIMSPSEIGLPYGTITRLLLSWLTTTEAVRTEVARAGAGRQPVKLHATARQGAHRRALGFDRSPQGSDGAPIRGARHGDLQG